jgi:hypothetical protein
MPINPYDDLLAGAQAPSANPYDEVLRETHQDQVIGLKSAVRQSADTTPETAARTLRLAEQFNVPADVVKRNLSLFEKRATLEAPNYDRLLTEAPALAAFASQPDHAALVKDDLPALTTMERLWKVPRNLAGAAGAGLLDFAQGFYGFEQAAYDALGLPSWAARGAQSALVAGQLAERVKGPQTGAGLVERSIYGGVESIGNMAPSLILGAISGGTSLLSLVGLTTGGQTYAQARGQGASVGRSLAAGSIQGTIEVATEFIPAHRLLKDLTAKSGMLTILAHQLVPEIAGEQVATVLQDLNEWAFLPANKDRTFADYLRERPSQAAATLISTITAVGATSVAGHAAGHLIDKLGQAATESKTLQRSPEKLAELVDQATKDTPAETLYAPIETWNTYWQSKGIDPAQIAQEVTGSPTAYFEAARTGEDLPIPTTAYVANLAATEHNAFFAKELRLAPRQMNAREAEAFGKNLPIEPPVSETIQAPSAVREAITGQLVAAGMERGTAETTAAILGPAFPNVADRVGLDVEALTRQWLPEVVSGTETPPTAGVQAESVAGAPPSAVAAAPASAALFQSLFHGSPHDFERFSTEKIGTGEGAQAYGHGLYFAENPNVAEGYQRSVSEQKARFVEDGVGISDDAARRKIADHLYTTLDDISKPVADSVATTTIQYIYAGRSAEDLIKTYSDLVKERPEEAQNFRRYQLAAEFASRYTVEKPAGRLYQVDIPDEQIAKMLDWNATFSEQPQSVQEGLRRLWKEKGGADTARPFTAHAGATGESIYAAVAVSFGGTGNEAAITAAASKALLRAGIPGLRYLDQGSRRIVRPSYQGDPAYLHAAESFKQSGATADEAFDGLKDAYPNATPGQREAAVSEVYDLRPKETRNVVVFDDSIVDITHKDGTPVTAKERQEFFQAQDANKEEHLGAFSMRPGQTPLIQLFEGRNLSTIYHEFGGHLFLEMMGDITDQLGTLDPSTLTPSQQRFMADYRDIILPYLGVESRAQVGTPEHEKFARSFEAFMLEGKAPSAELRGVFAKVRSWMIGIYRNLVGLSRAAGFDIHLTDDVRRVFDRLLASDAAIEEAQREAKVSPLFLDATTAGMTEPAFAAYRDVVQTASDKAKADLQDQALRDLQREQQAWWKAERKTMRAEVTGEIHQQPVYRARAAILRGMNPDGTSLTPGQTPVPLKGLSPDVLADQFGFASGDELQKALKAAPPMGTAIKTETDRRMVAKHGDLVLDGRLAERAQAAVMDHRQAVVQTELRALATTMAGTIPSAQVLKVEAQKRIAGTKVRDLRAGSFLAAATRASQRAFDLLNTNQDRQGAILAKQQELLNLALYREATAVRDEIDAAQSQWKRLFRPDANLAKTRSMEYVSAARALVAPLVYPDRVADVENALTTLRTYDPQVSELLDHYLDVGRVQGPLAQVTVDDFRGVRDLVAALWDTSKREGQIEIDGQLVSRETARAAMVAQLKTRGEAPYADIGVAGRPSKFDHLKNLALGGEAWLSRVEFWVTAMDEGQLGPFRTYLFNAVKDRVNVFRRAKVQRLTEYRALLDPIQSTLTTAKIAAPELWALNKQGERVSYTFGADGTGGMSELLGALLHTGNRTGPTSNMAKWLVGRGWGTIDDHDVLDTSRWDATEARLQREGVLTKAHYDFAQGIWDLFESLKPELQKAHHAIYGFYFKEVKADPIETPWGTYRGGYVPALADPLMSKAAEIRNEKQMSFESGTSFTLPTVGRRSTIARVRVFEPLAMNLAFIPQHLDWALRFTHIQPAVRDVSRLVTDKGLRSVLDGYDPHAGADLLMPWLMRSATQRINEAGKWKGLDRFMTAVRTRTGLQALAYSVNNGLQQFTGAIVAGVKIENKRFMLNAAWRYLRAPQEMGTMIREESAFMDTFLTSQAIEIEQQVNDILLNPSVYGKAAAFTRAHSQILASGSQNIVNHIVYLAAKDDAVAKGVHGFDAVRYADSIVRQTQGSFFPEDVSRFEANTPFVRSMAMFSTYFNMLLNLTTTETGIAMRSDRGLAARVARIGSVWTLGLLLSSAVSNGILNALSGNWDDDDDDTHLDEIFNLFLGSSVKTAFSMFPIAGQFATAAFGAVYTDQSYDDDIRISPTAGMIGSGIKDLAGHSSRKQEVKDFLSILGLITNLPLGALGKPIGYLMDVQDEKTAPENALDVARGLVTGRGAPRP